MTLSVHTNKTALLALQNLNKTNDQLASTQDKVSTGLKVGSAKDNAAVWAIAQGQRSDIGALSAVKASLNRATSITEVAMTAGESVSDLLNQLKEKVVTAMDPSSDQRSRTAMDNDFKAILKQITQVIKSAEFDGANLLDGSAGSTIQFLASADASQTITLSSQNLSLGGTILTLAATASLGTASIAATVMTALETSIANVNQALGNMGAQAKQIEAHTSFVSKLADTLEAGVGNLVDADLARESARLQALQVQQQLGVQALSIANQAPQVILSLFK